MASFDFTPPEFWSFPPFFTLQPVEATRSKQLALWKDLILKFHMARNLGSMTLAEFPYFENKAIGRRMDSKGITAVIESLIASGNAEWEDEEHSRARIMWRTSEALAADVYTWAKTNAFIGSIFTVYELLSSEEYQDSGFFGCDPVVFMKVLRALEKQNKCIIIEGETSEEDGFESTWATANFQHNVMIHVRPTSEPMH